MNRKIIIIGAGASGMMAAIIAARNHAQVTILEHTENVGKKILATGNGRCNLTNINQSPECYRSENTGFVTNVRKQFDVKQTLKLFGEIGIYTKNKNGYIYPNSEQASAILEAFKMELMHLKVKIIKPVTIKSIERKNKNFCIHTDLEDYYCDKIIVATGSKASPKTGSDGSGYVLSKSLGHTIIKPLPALVQLKCEGKYFKSIAGIRCDARLDLLIDGVQRAYDKGELQLTDYGISGIPTFQISRFAVRALDLGQEVRVKIDFMPDFELESFRKFLVQRMKNVSHKNLEESFIGLLNKKLVPVLIKKANLSPGISCKNMNEKQIEDLVWQIKAFEVTVVGSHSFEQAQVCSGGVDTKELNPETMESYKVPGVYFAGEVVDVDGICGGYNLQWAWSSGFVAGMSASNQKEK
jgi:predicted Rossmann fold flavoprotein